MPFMSLKVPKISSTHVDQWNTALLILSFIVAMAIPFRLLLFSYAFLGPLHYLTEIRWLEDRNYFVERKGFFRAVALIAALIAALPLILLYLTFFISEGQVNINSPFDLGSIALITVLILSALLVNNNLRSKPWLALFIGLVLALLLSSFLPVGIAVLGLFIPTIIHVYFFTGAFMISGYQKSKNKWSFLNVILFLIIPLAIALLPEMAKASGDAYLPKMVSAGFDQLVNGIAVIFRGDTIRQELNSPFAIKIQSFIAFAYTYHYLNWFSKTRIIGWSLSLKSTRSISLLISLWLGAVALYLFNFSLGLKVLFLLSFIHVILEFPLNFRTLKSILKQT